VSLLAGEAVAKDAGHSACDHVAQDLHGDEGHLHGPRVDVDLLALVEPGLLVVIDLVVHLRVVVAEARRDGDEEEEEGARRWDNQRNEENARTLPTVLIVQRLLHVGPESEHGESHRVGQDGAERSPDNVPPGDLFVVHDASKAPLPHGDPRDVGGAPRGPQQQVRGEHADQAQADQTHHQGQPGAVAVPHKPDPDLVERHEDIHGDEDVGALAEQVPGVGGYVSVVTADEHVQDQRRHDP